MNDNKTIELYGRGEPGTKIPVKEKNIMDDKEIPYYEDWGQNTRVEFLFALVNKRLDIPVSFAIECYYGELLGPVSKKIYDWSECEMIEMNNGEKVLIELVDYPDYYEQLADSPPETRAYFTYDGIVYRVSADTDIDGMKEVLADLGVL